MAGKRGPLTEAERAERKRKAAETRANYYEFVSGRIKIREERYGYSLQIEGRPNAYYGQARKIFTGNRLREFLAMHGTDAEKEGIFAERDRLGV